MGPIHTPYNRPLLSPVVHLSIMALRTNVLPDLRWRFVPSPARVSGVGVGPCTSFPRKSRLKPCLTLRLAALPTFSVYIKLRPRYFLLQPKCQYHFGLCNVLRDYICDCLITVYEQDCGCGCDGLGRLVVLFQVLLVGDSHASRMGCNRTCSG